MMAGRGRGGVGGVFGMPGDQIAGDFEGRVGAEGRGAPLGIEAGRDGRGGMGRRDEGVCRVVWDGLGSVEGRMVGGRKMRAGMRRECREGTRAGLGGRGEDDEHGRVRVLIGAHAEVPQLPVVQRQTDGVAGSTTSDAACGVFVVVDAQLGVDALLDGGGRVGVGEVHKVGRIAVAGDEQLRAVGDARGVGLRRAMVRVGSGGQPEGRAGERVERRGGLAAKSVSVLRAPSEGKRRQTDRVGRGSEGVGLGRDGRLVGPAGHLESRHWSGHTGTSTSKHKHKKHKQPRFESGTISYQELDSSTHSNGLYSLKLSPGLIINTTLLQNSLEW